jgi:hypothetical protein
MLTGAEDCTITDCLFDQLGGNAVCVSDYNHHVAITKSLIRDCGASGVIFVGNSAAVRSPLFNYSQRTTYAKVDRTPGPKSDDYPFECTVDDCLITRTGRIEKQSAGVEISMSRRITIRNCSIYEMPRAGINIGDGTWGGHVIDGCEVFDTVLETGDHGSFNAWGRDRYWQLRDAPVAELRSLAMLDAIEPTEIRNSRWRCDHGWDIDLDDGATNYQIHHNVLLAGGLKLREGFRREAWNNVIVNNSLHAHVWFPASGDSFTKNIVMGRYRPARMPVGKWGEKIDDNVFTTDDADRTAFATNGCDEHSLVGDPGFAAPATGDFRLKDSSPARALGITDVPRDFGVRNPKLRAQARSAPIPTLQKLSRIGSAPAAHWLGAEIRNIEGEEYSAFGLARDAGGVVILDAPGHSEAVRKGLRTGDVVIAIGNQRIKTIEDLTRLVSLALPPIELGIRRDQTDQVVRVTTTVSVPGQ